MRISIARERHMDVKITEIKERIKTFDKNLQIKKEIDNAWQLHKEFLIRFPFREHPERIAELTPKDLYNPGGSKDYFFTWIEHKLHVLGGIGKIAPRAIAYENAVGKLEEFKELLRIVVDDSKSLAQKLDAPWGKIGGWGGDMLIAKKIIFCYYPEKVIPLLKTDYLKLCAENLGIDADEEAQKKFGEPYDSLSPGQQWELLNESLLRLKASIDEIKDWDNAYFARFLYEFFVPRRPPARVLLPLTEGRLLFEPSNELGVVSLFSMYHKELGFPFIVKIGSAFPDAVVINSRGEPKFVEFEYKSSDFKAHGHDPELCDLIICWENDLGEEVPENWPEVLSLKEEIAKLKQAR
jgi:hypothetical protein